MIAAGVNYARPPETPLRTRCAVTDVSERGHRDFVTSVVWARDGRLASGSEDGTVRVWWMG
jgi:WD40 repeat protein